MTSVARLLRIAFNMGLLFILLIGWMYGTTALFLTGPGLFGLNVILACVFALFLPAVFIWTQSFLKGYLLCLCLFVVFLLWWQALKPTNDKDWAPDVARISHGEIQENKLIMHNVRNFDYKNEFIFYEKWETRTYDLNNLRGVDIFLSYWASEHIAHTIMSWDFGVDGHLAISIETRKDKTQEYSAVKGFFKQYEICYIAAAERDIIRLRTNFRKERVYLYRLQSSTQQALDLLRDYLEKMNNLVDQPEFYDALTHNCTTTIQLHVHAIRPDAPPPIDWRLIASGHVDELLYDRKAISTDLPFAELRKASRVDLNMQKEDKENFASNMRESIKAALATQDNPKDMPEKQIE